MRTGKGERRARSAAPPTVDRKAVSSSTELVIGSLTEHSDCGDAEDELEDGIELLGNRVDELASDLQFVGISEATDSGPQRAHPSMTKESSITHESVADSVGQGVPQSHP